MRDRLMKLLCGVECDGEETLGNCPQRRDGKCRTVQKLEMCQIGAIADHLLANGVIVLPCEVGATVYELVSWCDYTNCHFEGCAGCGKCNDRGVLEREFNLSHLAQIGKTVFRTREEAEQALKGGEYDA